MTFPVMDLNRSPRPGPASMTLYRVSAEQARAHPLMACDPLFRLELSDAFSRLYFLSPHSIVRSHLERRPLTTYICRHSYVRVVSLYDSPQGPYEDLNRCRNTIKYQRDLVRILKENSNYLFDNFI
jgi:hypothetical protein